MTTVRQCKCSLSAGKRVMFAVFVGKTPVFPCFKRISTQHDGRNHPRFYSFPPGQDSSMSSFEAHLRRCGNASLGGSGGVTNVAHGGEQEVFGCKCVLPCR